MTSRECAGLRVVENTLKDDWDRSAYGGMGPAVFAGVLGHVKIEILANCNLGERPRLLIAEGLAIDAAMETLPRRINIESWKLREDGRYIIATEETSVDVDPDYHLSVRSLL